ncbi:MAG: tetratricopeptide repeat protein [Gammaproteobacteria bacterium]
MKVLNLFLVFSLFLTVQAGWSAKAGAQENKLPDVDTLAGWIETGQYAQAQNALKQHLNKGTEDARIYFLLGIAQFRQGDLSAAITTLSTMTELFPQLPEAYINLAAVYAEQGTYEQARQTLLKAIAIAPDSALAHINLGDLYVLMAEQAYRQANRLERSNTYSATRAELLQTLNAR